MNQSPANILVEQALSAYQGKRFAEAEELWAAAGKLCAECGQLTGVASCHLNRGNALANLGRFAEAVAEFDRAEPIPRSVDGGFHRQGEPRHGSAESRAE